MATKRLTLLIRGERRKVPADGHFVRDFLQALGEAVFYRGAIFDPPKRKPFLVDGWPRFHIFRRPR